MTTTPPPSDPGNGPLRSERPINPLDPLSPTSPRQQMQATEAVRSVGLCGHVMLGNRICILQRGHDHNMHERSEEEHAHRMEALRLEWWKVRNAAAALNISDLDSREVVFPPTNEYELHLLRVIDDFVKNRHRLANR